jgi:dolichol-phosphate mannosyltransferase
MTAVFQQRHAFSIVVPVYECAQCLGELCARLEATLAKLTDRHEIILVDDRSLDSGWDTIVGLQSRYPSIRGIRLSRNFGQHIAITAGLAAAKGDVVVVMDCDLQDPPELMPNLYCKFLDQNDVVLTRRIGRNHSIFRVLASRAYSIFLSRLSGQNLDGRYSAYSMISRKVVDAFLRFNERERQYILMLNWLGFTVGIVEYEQPARTFGTTSYSLRSLIRLALDGVLFQTTALLKWIVGLGLLFAIFGVALSIYLIYLRLGSAVVAGWTSLAVLILLSTGAILTSLGAVALYIGKIFDQVKDRPLYVVDTISERTADW